MLTERAQRQSLIDERLREKDEREAEVMTDFTNEELQLELFAFIQRIGTQKVRVKQLSSEQAIRVEYEKRRFRRSYELRAGFPISIPVRFFGLDSVAAATSSSASAGPDAEPRMIDVVWVSKHVDEGELEE